MRELRRIALRTVVRLILLALGLAIAWNAGIGPAHAQTECAVTLEENEITVPESEPSVEIVVELEGGQVCTGAIRWATKAQTAKAASDFTAASGELRWTATDQTRRKPVTVALVNDALAEPTERFDVVLSDPNPNDGLTLEGQGGGGGGHVTIVSVTDDDKKASSPQPGTSSTRAPGAVTPTSTATAAPSTAASTAPNARPSAGTQPKGAGTIESRSLGAPGPKSEGGSGMTVPLLAAVLVLGGVGALILKRRGA